MRYMAISLHDIPMFEVEFLKNGSKFFNNTSSHIREYFLSYKPVSQLDALVAAAGIPTNIDKRK